jgi:hypothetical protein
VKALNFVGRKLLAAHWWLMTDWQGKVPEHLFTGNMHTYSWQWPVLAAGWLFIVVFTYVMLAWQGSIPWLPF